MSLLLLGCASMSVFLQTVLTSKPYATTWFSELLWLKIVGWLAGAEPSAARMPEVPFFSLFAICVLVLGGVWLLGSAIAKLCSSEGLLSVASTYGLIGGAVLLLPGVVDIASPMLPESIQGWLISASSLLFAFVLAVFCSVPVWLATGRPGDPSYIRLIPAWGIVLTGVGLFTAIFTWMNWGLYDNLLLPHGDSAMYEEHIWNLTHGKGFRSYLDQGLFLGEHIQVVHLLLTPLHLIWPSQLMMELCESIALAISAIPIFLIARRHTKSPMASAFLATAWLLYFPMHYLDIAIDFKTFRPMCFGIPTLLFGIDQWERKRFKFAWVFFIVALSAKEDFALVLAPLLWFLGMAGEGRKERAHGYFGFVAVTSYLIWVVLAVIPAFRSGEEVHYSRYFGELGGSPTEIAQTALTDPVLVASKLFTGRSVLYSILLLLPCGFLPLLSLRRVLVAVPVLGMLYLLEFNGQPVIPFHHFHATVIPILFWAAAVGLGRFEAKGQGSRAIAAAMFACFAAVFSGLFYSMSPLGIGFHDPGSRYHWRELYVESQRAREVQKVLEVIPEDARVASTDFVHTRLTHRERSYDYSDFRPDVPDDAEYIVIDAKHPWPGYTMASRVEDIKEMKPSDPDWEVVPVDTDGYFIVLKRKPDRAE